MKMFLNKNHKDLLLSLYDKYNIKEESEKSNNIIETIYVVLTEFFKKRGNNKVMGIIFDNNIVAGITNLVSEFLINSEYKISTEVVVGSGVTSMTFEWR